MNDFIQNYFQKFEGTIDSSTLQNNRLYFQALFEKFLAGNEIELMIHQPEAGIKSPIVPLPILDENRYPLIKDYEDLSEDKSNLKNFHLVVVKMHAGLGTSVKRKKELKAITGRSQLGSKGTDLFLEVDGQLKSLAELQVVQIEKLSSQNIFKSVSLKNLVNEETADEVGKFDNKFTSAAIMQLKVPTLLGRELTSERVAPAGHAFLGFSLLSSLFQQDSKTRELIVIGNGEDLNSTPDTQTLAWIVNNDIPVTMITTTKLAKDKKGGQISVVCGERDYVNIVEKAQADKAGQADYFEQLGLREGDKKSLFNTNIVVINSAALKRKLDKLNISAGEFSKIITPDLIKNTKLQDAKEFTQLEGAIGSTLLNLDKYFRLNLNEPIVSFLNLNPKSRELFFIPIKTIDDFQDIKERYYYNSDTGRLELKE